MSIVNVVAYTNRLVIAVDTDAVVDHYDAQSNRLTRERGHLAKLLPIVHHPSVIAYRGSNYFPSGAAATAIMARDFDELLEKRDAIASALLDYFDTQAEAIRATTAEIEIILGGWSARRKQCEAYVWHKPAGGSFTLTPILQFHVAPPPHENYKPVRAPEDVADHLALARLQVSRLRQADFAGGGDLVIASLTCNSLDIEVVRGFA